MGNASASAAGSRVRLSRKGVSNFLVYESGTWPGNWCDMPPGPKHQLHVLGVVSTALRMAGPALARCPVGGG